MPNDQAILENIIATYSDLNRPTYLERVADDREVSEETSYRD